jgi:hypothetical protein
VTTPATGKVALNLQLDPFEAIHVERGYQETAWGPEKDDNNGADEWRAYRLEYEVRAQSAIDTGDKARARVDLVKLAALAVAQIEALDRHMGLAQPVPADQNNAHGAVWHDHFSDKYRIHRMLVAADDLLRGVLAITQTPGGRGIPVGVSWLMHTVRNPLLRMIGLTEDRRYEE